MSGIKGKVGARELHWHTIPRGQTGKAEVEIDGKRLEICWKKDADGIWLELPNGVYGFDFEADRNDEGLIQYQLTQRSSDLTWAGVAFRRAGEDQLKASGESKKRGTRVRAQMPGKIVRVLAAAGDSVAKDQPVIVMEAMKMENEIRASTAGKLGKVTVIQGQAVETGAELFTIEPETTA